MTLTSSRQRMLAIVALLVLVSIVILGLISFEISQHMNVLWQVFHSVGIAGNNGYTRHP